jgi:threonine dehydrogenase-like Zn-dependent dehydrogenase
VIPDGLTDEQVLMLPDIASTGISGAESGNVRIGDSVAVFAQGPIGLCATVGARLRGAGLIVGIDPVPERRAMAQRFGATVTLDPAECDIAAELKRLTGGRGVDVAIEALGRQETFESALRSIRPGGVLSSLGVYSGKLVAPYEAIHAGLADQRIVTTLCPGGKERMRRLMEMVSEHRIDLTPLITHRFALDDLQEAYDLFSHQRDRVMKVAIYPQGVPAVVERVEEMVDVSA